ncbi:MAG: hypothetical protein JO019_03415 [Candidatus Kaiserbacteria bacterium]|nr:hypothetical protein [Candidatus Kaiserbacteria bacterium]
MAKFVAIYRVPLETMADWKKNTSQEEMMKQGKELGDKMMAWTAKNKSAFVGEGLPLGKNTRITKDGAKDETNDLNYLSIIEAENKDAVIAMFKDNPHFDIPTSFIDIMEVPHMGM